MLVKNKWRNKDVYAGVNVGTESSDYVDNGTIARNVMTSAVMIETSADVALLDSYPPTTIAYTAGYQHMWQKGTDGKWYAITDDDDITE